MTSKKIAVLVLVGLVLALAIGIISAPEGSEGSVIIPAVKNASVSPAEGRYTDSFTYTVDVRFYEEVLIEFQLYDPTKKDWITHKTLEYRDSRSWQPFEWDWIPSDRAWEGQNVSYRFRWDNTYLGYGNGPYIIPVIAWEFRNAIVRPSSGYYNDNFSYSVSVKLNKEEGISLEVFNISNYTWEVRGEKQYNDTSNWQELKWDNIANIASADSEGLASYRFFFIESGERHESPIYYGPTLKPVIDEERFENATISKELFKNATVYPSRGDFSTAFNYTVEVNNTYGGIEINNVTLEVYNGSWRPKGPGTSSPSGNKWEWRDITFGEGYEGVAKYKFLCNNNYESAVYDGPLLLDETPTIIISGGGGGGGGSSYKPYMQYENANVEPNDWTIKGAIESKTFYYSVEVDKKDMLILEIYNPSSNEWEEKGKGNESNLKGEWGKWRHEWNVTLTLDKNWAGYGKYRFYPERWEKYASQVYYGPEIKMPSLSEWKEEIGFSDEPLGEPVIICTVDPTEEKWFKKFTYTANITHPDKANMTVVLFVYKPGSDEWKPVPWREDRFNPILNPSDYNETTNTAPVIWTVEKREVFDEEDAGGSSKFSRFYIWYWDGWNEADCKKLESEDYEGPEVLVQPKLLLNREPEFVRDLKPKPENGSTHSIYEYKFEVNDPDGEAVDGLLTVLDPFNEEHLISGMYKEGNLTFRVGPDLSIFTELGEYKNFTSHYRLEYWDEGMMVDGKTNQEPKDGWFTGPNVSLVECKLIKARVIPEKGKYTDEFVYYAEFESSRENLIKDVRLIIYDSNPEKPIHNITIPPFNISAGESPEVELKTSKPVTFKPGYMKKRLKYRIEWSDKYGNEGGKDLPFEGPYIERAVPFLSVAPLFLAPAFAVLFILFGSRISWLWGMPVKIIRRIRRN